MAHANARLTPFGRLVLVQPVLELGWSVGPAAGAVGVSRTSRDSRRNDDGAGGCQRTTGDTKVYAPLLST